MSETKSVRTDAETAGSRQEKPGDGEPQDEQQVREGQDIRWDRLNQSPGHKSCKHKALTFLAFSRYILYLSSIAFISSSFF